MPAPLTLDETPVVVVDCQTTGATPARGHLLEIGWCVVRAADPPSDDRVVAHLVRLPPGSTVPAAVQRLTGIGAEAMTAAIDPAAVWGDLVRDLGLLAAAMTPQTPAIAVAHFARFEETFLRELHRRQSPRTRFPLRFICTHEIARRLFPDLPRRSLRALAGYCGRSLPELRRAGEHSAATALLWRYLLHRLREELEVRHLDDLERFLAAKAPGRGARWQVPLPRSVRLAVSDRPGVYRFRAADGAVLYVGKARSLRHRVNSYYRKRRADGKTLELLSQTSDVETSVTASALEAALMEAEEIRRLDPPYNRALRPRGRGVWFYSYDLASARRTGDPGHPIGPVLGRESFDAVAFLSRALSAGPPFIADETAAARALGLARREREPAAIEGAVGDVVARHGIGPGDARPANLIAIGTTILHRRRQAAAVRADDGVLATAAAEAPPTGSRGHTRAAEPPGPLAGVDTGNERTTERAWTRDEIASALEDHLVQASRLARRARWFALLSGAAIVWTPEGRGDSGPARLLRVTGGSIGVAVDHDGDHPPAPERSALSPGERISALDRPCCERLGVLTSEIRRLVSAGREIRVLLDTGCALGPRELRRVLALV